MNKRLLEWFIVLLLWAMLISAACGFSELGSAIVDTIRGR